LDAQAHAVTFAPHANVWHRYRNDGASMTTFADPYVNISIGLAECQILIPLAGRVTIPAADWKAFKAWAHAPAKQVPALRDLAARTPAWRDQSASADSTP
jgi:hypothetical protein